LIREVESVSIQREISQSRISLEGDGLRRNGGVVAKDQLAGIATGLMGE
jgi:hypothetical protein